MLRSVLMGLVAGSRAMTPVAAVANAARTGKLPKDSAAPEFLASPLISASTMALAAYELAGDKQASAPDRVITPAVVVRTVNAALAGAAVAPRDKRWLGAALAGGTAAAAAYVSWRLRMRAMQGGGGQAITGFIEDAVIVPLAVAAATR
ncbi:DUF4126 family protein [Sphingomonas sp. GC_Shp_3]|uniref:DUF4126 family protein n=1 Tax=Sphingomonas sp. GC_Shp_3 TaxID=2937383 RepID=UPI00226AAE41|nr:DUF4126 family protein [Sphingomonas sp. GC_Shp_3]